MYNIRFNDICCLDMGVLVKVRPNIPAPVPAYEPIIIPGRDGIIMPDDVRYEPITIEVEMNFMSPDPQSWSDAYRRAKKWLKGSGTLKLSDDEDFYYKVYIVSIDASERTSKRIGSFTASFLCDPYQYLNSGTQERADVSYNPYSVSLPVYHITAAGEFTLTVNGNTLTGTGETYVDTALQVAYNTNYELISTTTVGDFSELYLKEGENSISVSGGTLIIRPNWRTI